MAITHRLKLLTMFAGPVERDPSRHFGHARTYLSPFGFDLEIWPFTQRPTNTTYQALLNMKGSIDHYDEKGAVPTIAKWAQHSFRDQVASMCVLVFCRLARKSVGAATFAKGKLNLPFSMILFDPVHSDGYAPALAHEIGHATGLPDDHARFDNLMFENDSANGTNLTSTQVTSYQKAYFAQAA